MIAGVAEVITVVRSLLFAMGRADAAVHVENDHLRWAAVMNTVNPHPVHVGQNFNVRLGRLLTRDGNIYFTHKAQNLLQDPRKRPVHGNARDR
jgi:hypothetical protein